MEIEKVCIGNFLSFKLQEFEIKDKGLTLIEGRNLDEGDSNGSGKSALWDSISFCLFGQTVRGLKGDEVINRKFKKNCWVNVRLRSFGKIYEVFRYRKHDERGDRFFILDMDEDKCIEMGTAAQTQQWLLDTFQIDFDLFRCTVLFAQGETFNFVDAGNKGQKEILSKVMKIDYDKFLINSKTKLKSALSDLTSIESKVTVLTSHLIKDADELFAAEISEWDGQQERRITAVKTEVEAATAQIKWFESNIKPVDKIASLIKKAELQIKIDRGVLGDIMAKSSEAKGSLSFHIKDLKKAEELEAKGECHFCKTKVSICLNQEWITSAKNSIEIHQVTVAKCDEEAVEINNKINKNLEVIKKADKILIGQNHVKSNLKNAIARQKELDIELVEIQSEENPFLTQKWEAIAKQEQIKNKIKELNKNIGETKKSLPYLEFWVNAFSDSGIKSFVFDLICSNLTNKANSYLNILSGGSVSISFDTQKKTKSGELREKFDCNIVTDGIQVAYNSYSGGEKRRISLAVDMALSDIMVDYHGSSFNVVVFDEQDSYLDSNGRKQYLNLLKKIGRNKKVFVVAHDASFKGYFDDVMVVEKRDGISRIA